MQVSQKRYNIVVTGQVQNIGFRDFVEKLANFIGLKGYIFNDLDGSVKMTLEGEAKNINLFLEDIKSKTKNVGAEIKSIKKQEISVDSYLPPRFIKIPSTEYGELGRKFDIGIDLLKNIRSDLGGMKSDIGGIKTDTSTLYDIRDILGKIAEKI